MPTYKVYYMKPDWFREGICGARPTIETLSETHTILAVVQATSLDDLFVRMQGDRWSPGGEANELLTELRLNHTSMSVGDVAIAPDGSVNVCMMVGWAQLELIPDKFIPKRA